MNLLKKLFAKNVFLRNLYGLRRGGLRLLYRPEDMTLEYYERAKNCGDTELEHQIGRLSNFKKILAEVKNADLSGDIIEFGSWRGFSLLWLAFWRERFGLFEKKNHRL